MNVYYFEEAIIVIYFEEYELLLSILKNTNYSE
jgi:hypothetical protein